MSEAKLNFSVGPVMMSEDVRRIGQEQIPYFRTSDFSALMKENEQMLKELTLAEEESRVIFLTASGTGGMEMAIMNCFGPKDKVLIVNGGSFGKRFVALCRTYGISYEDIDLKAGESLNTEHLLPFEGKGFTGFLVNMHETSTGVLYDMEMIGDFCKRNQMFLVVDAISAFLADELRMAEWGIDVLIISSQKALALPPGMSFLVLNRKAMERINQTEVASLYFDIKEYLKDGERGQTPYTPAVSILIQLHARLRKVQENGREAEIKRVKSLADYFRKKIEGLPLKMFTETPSNAVTALLTPEDINAHEVFERIEAEYDIWICPNGGELKEQVFRVGHIGELTHEDYDRLVEALTAVLTKGSVYEQIG